MDFKLGKSNSVKSSFLLIVNELPIEVNLASSTFSTEQDETANEPLATVKVWSTE